jgi:hypothetical protein
VLHVLNCTVEKIAFQGGDVAVIHVCPKGLRLLRKKRNLTFRRVDYLLFIRLDYTEQVDFSCAAAAKPGSVTVPVQTPPPSQRIVHLSHAFLLAFPSSYNLADTDFASFSSSSVAD